MDPRYINIFQGNGCYLIYRSNDVLDITMIFRVTDHIVGSTIHCSCILLLKFLLPYAFSKVRGFDDEMDEKMHVVVLLDP